MGYQGVRSYKCGRRFYLGIGKNAPNAAVSEDIGWISPLGLKSVFKIIGLV